MIQKAIEALLREKIGLNTDLITPAALAKAMGQCMADGGFADAETYLLGLQASTRKLDELAEKLAVLETWFFRDEKPFEFLSHHVMREWLSTRRDRVFRVLSAPCSTGEEPYSIAMALMDAGLPLENIHIDAVDLSREALLVAGDAVYGKNSFRSKDLSFKGRYFEQTERGYRLVSQVCRVVHFTHGNILESSFPARENFYDAIFCRNLLIYFNPSARERTIQVLSRSLVEGGLLFLGAAETGQIASTQFIPVHQSGTFAHQKVGASHPQTKPDPEQSAKKPRARSHRKEPGDSLQKTHVALQPFADRVAPRPSDPSDDRESLLEKAGHLADQGRLDEATALCESYLQENKTSAQAHFLLGLVHQASGHANQAEEYFDRAVYLEPDHREALTHLALIAEQRSDTAAAERLKQRARKDPI